MPSVAISQRRQAEERHDQRAETLELQGVRTMSCIVLTFSITSVGSALPDGARTAAIS
jgi:hypothetical protein